MEIAVTGVYYPENAKAWWTDELITREQAIASLTINVAKQMFLENERGSISNGKYADFLLVNKDVLSCPVTEIHTAKPAATYFEGKKVFLCKLTRKAYQILHDLKTANQQATGRGIETLCLSLWRNGE